MCAHLHAHQMCEELKALEQKRKEHAPYSATLLTMLLSIDNHCSYPIFLLLLSIDNHNGQIVSDNLGVRKAGPNFFDSGGSRNL